MLVLWFTSETDCTAALDMINANQRGMAVDAGYELDESGAIIGKDATGNSQPEAQVTTTWDVVHYDEVSARWYLADPAVHFSSETTAAMLENVTGYERGEYVPPSDAD